MKNVLISVLTTLLAFSCAGYFQDDPVTRDKTVQPLAVAGGGYLSSDTANERCPYIFHDTLLGKRYIVYSSDKSGNYDLYYAEMDAQNNFYNSIRFGSNINTTSNEIAGVLFRAFDSTTTNLYLTIIRNNSLSYTNLICYELNSDFSYHSIRHDTGFKAENLSITPGINPMLMYTTNGTNFITVDWVDSGNIGWYGGLVPQNIGINSNFIYSVGLGYYSTKGGFIGSNYIITLYVNGHYQMFIAGIWASPSVVSNTAIAIYSSDVNDRDPYVDIIDNYKVYFSSDRYGKGNYDLYRYNLKTFNITQPLP